MTKHHLLIQSNVRDFAKPNGTNPGLTDEITYLCIKQIYNSDFVRSITNCIRIYGHQVKKTYEMWI
jgi:hypothetical protein